MNKLLKYIFVLFILSIGCKTYAQVIVRDYPNMHRRPPEYINRYNRPDNSQTRVEMIKERFIAQQLQLNQEQVRKFFPLYHEYQQELFNIRKLKRINDTNSANGTDQINKDLAYDADMVAVRRKFNDAFLRILPPEKVSQLYKCERQFNDELVRQLSERNGRPVN
jgi:hypothetical protein